MPFEITPVTVLEIETYLQNIVNRSQILYPNQHDFFVNLLNLGVRYSDLANIQNFTLTTNDTVLLHAPKNDNYYTFPLTDLSPNLAFAIAYQDFNYYNFSYYLVERWFNRFALGVKYFHKTKPLSLHLFRHLKAKVLKSQGLTDEQIRVKLAEKKLTSAQSYIYSNITKEHFVSNF